MAADWQWEGGERRGAGENRLVERVHQPWVAENNGGGGTRADAQVCSFLGKSQRHRAKDGWSERLAGLGDVRG